MSNKKRNNALIYSYNKRDEIFKLITTFPYSTNKLTIKSKLIGNVAKLIVQYMKYSNMDSIVKYCVKKLKTSEYSKYFRKALKILSLSCDHLRKNYGPKYDFFNISPYMQYIRIFYVDGFFLPFERVKLLTVLKFALDDENLTHERINDTLHFHINLRKQFENEVKQYGFSEVYIKKLLNSEVQGLVNITGLLPIQHLIDTKLFTNVIRNVSDFILKLMIKCIERENITLSERDLFDLQLRL